MCRCIDCLAAHISKGVARFWLVPLSPLSSLIIRHLSLSHCLGHRECPHNLRGGKGRGKGERTVLILSRGHSLHSTHSLVGQSVEIAGGMRRVISSFTTPRENPSLASANIEMWHLRMRTAQPTITLCVRDLGGHSLRGMRGMTNCN